MNDVKTCVIVVTYNRQELLLRCLDAISKQSRQPDILLVIDNASTDLTNSVMKSYVDDNTSTIFYERLHENLGGAGGFKYGLQMAVKLGSDWIWMMDDDASPHVAAFEELMIVSTDRHNIYGSIATNGEATSWTTTLVGPPIRSVDRIAEIPVQAEVYALPFLGFMIHRDLVNTIGLPDAGFFIAADDIEYCIRASRAGAKIIVAGRSHIEHPRTQRYSTRVFGIDITYLRLPPWKRYYDTRNRLLIARKYYGIRLLTQTIPGSFVRLWLAIRHEPRKLGQMWAFCTGMFDGLLGIKGRRHAKWGIRQ